MLCRGGVRGRTGHSESAPPPARALQRMELLPSSPVDRARVSGRGPSLSRIAGRRVSGWSTMDTCRPPHRLHRKRPSSCRTSLRPHEPDGRPDADWRDMAVAGQAIAAGPESRLANRPIGSIPLCVARERIFTNREPAVPVGGSWTRRGPEVGPDPSVNADDIEADRPLIRPGVNHANRYPLKEDVVTDREPAVPVGGSWTWRGPEVGPNLPVIADDVEADRPLIRSGVNHANGCPLRERIFSGPFLFLRSGRRSAPVHQTPTLHGERLEHNQTEAGHAFAIRPPVWPLRT